MLSAMTLNAVSLVVATLVINVKKKGDRKGCPRVPQILLKLCHGCLAKLTCTTMITNENLYRDCDEELLNYTHAEENAALECSEVSNEIEEEDGSTQTCDLTEKYAEKISNRRQSFDVAKTKYREIRNDNARLEWYFVAEVLDKLLFVIYLTGMVLTVTVILFIVPQAQYD